MKAAGAAEAAEKKLRRLKKKLLRVLREEDADFGLRLATNAEMNRLRRELLARPDFKGAEARKIARERTVEVLAFPEPKDFPHPESRGRWLGEVHLNLDANARDPDRLGYLMVHGVLHLLGYRHDAVRDIIKMEDLEKKLCKQLGISK